MSRPTNGSSPNSQPQGQRLSIDAGRPMSEVIRARVDEAGKRCFSNDNIAEFIHSEEEFDALRREVEANVQRLLRSLVIDIDSDHNTQGTARRVAKLYLDEVFSGRYRSQPAMTAFPNIERIDELMAIGPITVRSACSHHLCPIMGKLWIGVLPRPDTNLIGLSKFARLADWIMNRPQIQEEAVKTLADELEQRLMPEGVAVVMEATHFCMKWRGVKDNDARMITSVMRGQFLRDQTSRKEFLDLIRR